MKKFSSHDWVFEFCTEYDHATFYRKKGKRDIGSITLLVKKDFKADKGSKYSLYYQFHYGSGNRAELIELFDSFGVK